MDIAKFYDEYWTEHAKTDTVDYSRLAMILKDIEPGKTVLEINCGASLLAKKILEKGNDITVTDISNVALEKAKSRGIKKIYNVDIDTESLPAPLTESKFDIILSNSMIEHYFSSENTIKEGIKALKEDGKFIVVCPNIGHWRFRLWLLFGRFPCLENTPTDILHLRFLTVHSLKEIGKKYGLRVEKVEGHAGVWVNALYPVVFNVTPIKQIYESLANIYPSLFARYVLITFEKKK